mgnify:CR=1 FL=1
MEGKKNNKRIAKLLKKAKGVTMLALVVTIIVLLILAAITLSLAVGENGIIKRAKLARDKAKNASIAEEEAMNLAAGEIDNAGNGNSSGGGTCPECPDTKPLEDRIKELESQVGALQQQLEEERANKQELENRITELNNQIADLNKQIEAGNTEKAKLQEEITKLQNQLTTSQTENEKLKAQIAELNKQVTNLNTQLGEKNKTIETQKQEIANLQGQIIEKDKVISQKNETIKTMQSTIDGLNTQIANLNRQIEALKAKQATGNAAVSDVLAGKTFSNSSGVGLVGTMANRAGQMVAWSGYETISVQPHPDDNNQGLVTISNQYGADGYYNGDSKITGNIANLNANNIKAGVNVGRFDGTAGITGTFTSDGTATANNLSNGATAYVNGQKITGNGADVNNAWSSGHTAGYNEGYNATVKTVSGELLPEAGAINTVNCGFRPNRVFVYNMTRYSTYLYDIRIPHVMFGYVNGNWHPMSDYQDVLFEVLDNGFRFKSGYAYTGDKWIWMASQ